MNEDLNKTETDKNSLIDDSELENHGANLEEKDYGRESEDSNLGAKADDLEMRNDNLNAKTEELNMKSDNLDMKSDNLDMKSDSLETSNENKKDRGKLIFRIVILIIILGFGTWLTIFFLKDNTSDYSFYNSENVNENNFLENNNISAPENSLEGESSEAISSRPVTVIDNDYRMSVVAPTQSPVVNAEELPLESIKIIGTDNGFSPQEFSVSPGQEITLSLTAQSASPIVLTFYDSRMAAVSIGCGPGDTRYVSFKAPTDKGEYLFINDVFGKRDQEGKMIVR